MKATIELPEDLYRQVKTRSAIEGRTVREVTIRLYEQWLQTIDEPTAPSRLEELGAVYHAMDKAFKKQKNGRTARKHLEDDRNRLESR
jgi:hypothetical protein